MQKLIQHQKDEKALADILAAVILGLYLTNVMVGIGRFIGLSASVVSLAAKLLILGAIARCTLIFFDRLNFPVVLFTYVFLLILVVQLLFFPENRQFLFSPQGVMNSTVFTFLITILPAVYTICVIGDFDMLLRRLQDAGVIASGCTLVILLVFGGDTFEKYCMGFAGAMILPTCLTITRAANKRQSNTQRMVGTILSAADVFYVAMFGSRGGFVAITSFILYYFLWEQLRKQKLAAILETVGMLFLAGNYKKILNAAGALALGLGFYSRTLQSLGSESVSDSGRSRLYTAIGRDILAHPLKIRGINSDYEVVGFYCHNWFLELLHAFGVLVGGFFCLMIVSMICRVLWKGRRDSRSILLICLTFAFFPTCLVSGSIWRSTWFWTWAALFFLQEPDAGNRKYR